MGKLAVGGNQPAVESSRLKRLFEFLKSLEQIRNPIVRDLRQQRLPLSLRELPRHPAVELFDTVAAEPAEDAELAAPFPIILRVRKPATSECPEPPPGLADWLSPGWRDPEQDAAFLPSRNEPDENGATRTALFEANPARREAFSSWSETRAAWSAAEKPARHALRVYEHLFAIHTELRADSGKVELILGNGHLVLPAAPGAAPISHPFILQRVSLDFNPKVPQFTVRATDDLPRLDDALLFELPWFDASVKQRVEGQVREGVTHLAESGPVNAVLGAFTHAVLGPRGRFFADGKLDEQTGQLSVWNLPSLFVRKKTLGLVTALNRAQEHLIGEALPPSLLRICGFHEAFDDAGSGLLPPSPEHRLYPNERSDVLLSKEANEEQLAIVDRLRAHDCVIVQGPPGTGKTHTIANLLGHFLAEGKSVLVTAHTSKALRVLRDKVVETLQPLCVAVLENDAANREQLKQATEAIIDRCDQLQPEATARDISSLEAQRTAHLDRIAGLRRALNQALEAEYAPIVFGGESVSPVDAAKSIRSEQTVHGWIPGQIARGEVCPLSDAEFNRLLQSCVGHDRQDERDLRGEPDGLEKRPDLWTIPLSGQLLDDLELACTLAHRCNTVLERFAPWQKAIVRDSLSAGHDPGLWTELVSQLETFLAADRRWRSAQVRFGAELTLTSPVEEGQVSAANAMLDRIRTQGRLRWNLFLPQSWKTLLANFRTEAGPPKTPEHFEALRDGIEVRWLHARLVNRWNRQVAAIGGPELPSTPVNPDQLTAYPEQILRALRWAEAEFGPLLPALRKAGFAWDVYASQHASAANALENLTAALQGPLVSVLQERHRAKATHEQRQMLFERLDPKAPALAASIQAGRPLFDGDRQPRSLQGAWRWKQLQQALEERHRTSPERIQKEIETETRELRRVTENLIRLRSWVGLVKRVTGGQKQALAGYAQIMNKVGRGTGKSAPRLLAEAKARMLEAQGAVPVWIMPLARVFETFNPAVTRFDVLIIDEASQSDISALVTLCLAKQVIVVGDDEQVAPDALGPENQQIFRLQELHLHDVPNRALYDLNTSIYDLAKASFPGVVVLREHFRCVPDIIGYSNELSYGGRIVPLREAASSPVQPALVAHAVEALPDEPRTNRAEALELAALLAACVRHPAYATNDLGRPTTFGVISLSGSDQNNLIDALLREKLDPDVYIGRRLLCGTPAQFQGDERDVIFLTMVDTAGGHQPLGLRREGARGMYKKRFNVAVSRARNQLWLVHSLNAETDLKAEDIRRGLLDYFHRQRQAPAKSDLDKTESDFERHILEALAKLGFHAVPQYPVGAYRIDLVVTDGDRKVAVECDGERFHGIERRAEDHYRQAQLERLGWRFIRIRGSQFYADPPAAVETLRHRLEERGIRPLTGDASGTNAVTTAQDLVAEVKRRAQQLKDEWLADPEFARRWGLLARGGRGAYGT